MARRIRSRSLNVWMNGVLVGRWTLPGSGVMEFVYDREWLASADGRPLSLSLPISNVALNGPKVEAFFDNLLPDSRELRSRLQSRFKTASQNAFDLLEAIGRDCVGAIQLLPEDKTPDDIFCIHAQPLSEEDIERRIELATTTSIQMGQATEIWDEGEFRLSIAGAQEKTAFLRHEGRWCAPFSSTPTTHIFKLPLGLVGHMQADMRTSVENEWLCSEIVHQFGLPVARCQIETFGRQKVLIVERFDRKLAASGRHWLRLPQEDFCQALGYPSALKYEGDGGPGMGEFAHILAHSENRDKDRMTFMQSQLLYWLLAAPDGHAKNFSLFMRPGGRYQLAPLYDVLSAWPVIGRGARDFDYKKTSLAMSLHGRNRHRQLSEIQRRHFVDTATSVFKMTAAEMQLEIDRVVEQTPVVIEAVGNRLPGGFPMDVFEAVAAGMKKHALKLETAGRIVAATPPSF